MLSCISAPLPLIKTIIGRIPTFSLDKMDILFNRLKSKVDGHK